MVITCSIFCDYQFIHCLPDLEASEGGLYGTIIGSPVAYHSVWHIIALPEWMDGWMDGQMDKWVNQVNMEKAKGRDACSHSIHETSQDSFFTFRGLYC